MCKHNAEFPRYPAQVITPPVHLWSVTYSGRARVGVIADFGVCAHAQDNQQGWNALGATSDLPQQHLLCLNVYIFLINIYIYKNTWKDWSCLLEPSPLCPKQNPVILTSTFSHLSEAVKSVFRKHWHILSRDPKVGREFNPSLICY